MKILRTLLLLVGLMLVLNACVSPTASVSTTPSPVTSTGTVIATPSLPLSVHLAFSKLPTLNEPLYLSCSVYSKYDAPNSTAQIKLPEGVSFISGDLQWQGDLIGLYYRTFTAQVVFKEPGNQTIEATVKHIIDNENSWNALDAVTLEFGPNGLPTSTLPDSTLPDRRIDRYAVIETDLEISHAPKLNEPATLSVTITSPVGVPRVDVNGLKAEIMFPRGEYELLDGNLTLPVTIKAGEPIHFSAVVAFKETGYWPISACVSELVIKGGGPAGIYYNSPGDTIFLKVGVDQSTFESLPQPPPAIIP